jgi:hypothetical protein
MSPEQVRGRESDKRADIWAFGAVLFEMLTGRASFSGETLSDTITSVLSHEIPWNSLPPIVPSELRNLLRRCLERDSNRRLRDIGDARIVIDELLEGRSAPKVQPRATTKPSRLLHAMAALGWILAGVLLALLWPQPEAPAPWTGTRVGGSDIALTPRVAPDQKRIAFLALVKGVSQVGVLDPKSGNFTVLTTSRTNGYTGAISWSVDGTRIYYTRMQGIPRGIYSVPALGGDERLVLENAKGGEALPDGSLIVSRIINRRAQIHRFWPVNGRLEPLPAFIPVEGDSFPVRLLPDGSGAVFLGRTGNDTGERSRLHLLSFSTGRAEAIPIDDSLPETSIPVETLPFAITPKGESVLILVPSGDRLRILEISIDGRHKPQPILDLQAGVWGFDVGADGSIYVDQVRRPIDILRFTTAGKELQRVAVVPNLTMLGLSLYLADGRTLVPAVSGGRRRLLTVSPGEDATPFIDTDEQTSPPVVHAGKDRVAFLIGSRSGSRIAIATVQDGRIIRQIDVPLDPAARPTMAFSPDGKTLYFSRSGSIWRLLLDQGQPEKLHPGDGVATMPDGKNLIISFNEEPIRWAIYSLEKGTEQPIRAGPDFRLTPVPPAPGSASPDGRILLPIAVPDSWFYSPGLFDPRTGAVQRIPLPYVGDFFDLGWTPDGKVVAAGYPFESTIWRFERVAAAP